MINELIAHAHERLSRALDDTRTEYTRRLEALRREHEAQLNADIERLIEKHKDKHHGNTLEHDRH